MTASPLIASYLRCCLGTAKVVKHRDVILRIRALAGEVIADHGAVHTAGECHGLQASKIQLTAAGGADQRPRFLASSSVIAPPFKTFSVHFKICSQLLSIVKHSFF